MNLTAAEVSRVLDELQSGALSREAAEEWATRRMEAFDRHERAFTPGTEEHRLWDALIFLCGIALQAAPGSYLHGDEDVDAFRARTML